MRVMVFMTILALGAGGCSPTSAPAAEDQQAETQKGPALVDRFDADLVTRLFAEMDYSVTRTGQATSSDVLIEFEGPDGEAFSAAERHCAEHTPGVSCAGIVLTGRIEIDPAAGLDALDYANSFNQEQAGIHMYADEGDVVVSDDIILNGGVSEANLQGSLAGFSTVLRQHRDFLLRVTGKRD